MTVERVETGEAERRNPRRKGRKRSAPTSAIVAPERSAAAEAAKASWARRHPKAAAGERAIRKARAETIDRWRHKNAGTPETHERHARHNEGAIARLHANKVIDDEQLASAAEIAAIAERIGADVQVKTASFETRVDQSPSEGGFHEALSTVRREIAYTRWRGAVPALRSARGVPIAAVLDMIVWDRARGEGPVGYTVAAARHGIGATRAKRLLIDALDLWPRCKSEVWDAVDEDDLDRAHARLERL